MKSIASFFVLLLLATSARASAVEGFWTGTAVRGGESVPISMRVETVPSGLRAYYNIPSLSLEGMPLPSLTFDPLTGALTAPHAFNGIVQQSRITGKLTPALLDEPPVTVDLTLAGTPPELTTKERAIQFTSRGNVLKGLLITAREAGRHPALVSLHGSGPSTRWLALARARRFAEAGYAMLIFDKPGSGESTGDWTTTSLDEMAQDAIAAVEFLKAQPEIDPSKVGLWGHSQAGNIISRAGATSNEIAFAIVLAGGGATPKDVEDYGYLGRLRYANATPATVDRAMSWVRDYYAYLRTGKGYDALAARLKIQPTPEWVKALDIGTVYPLPQQQPKWQWVATYDPKSDIRRIHFPVLLLFADQDENSPSKRSLASWRQALDAAGNHRVEWKIFKNAEHHFLTPAHTDGWPRMSPAYYETQIEWLRRVVGR